MPRPAQDARQSTLRFESSSPGTMPLRRILAPLPVLSRRNRTSAPKSRSGCKTCKTRHVKCDESKPACKRCVNLGISCDGYRRPDLITASQRKQLWALAPAKTENQIQTQMSHARNVFAGAISKANLFHEESKDGDRRFGTQLTNHRPSLAIFSSDKEQMYFDYYRQVTAKQISGWFSGNVWRYLTLQAAHETGFVRHCLVAIGALGKSQEISKSEDGSDKNEDVLAAEHRHFAFHQYASAIRLIRKCLTETSNIRTVLLSCLLTVCFENILGGTSNREDICAQIAQGVNLLKNWEKKQNPLPNDRMGLGSPNPVIVEDDLYQAFALLDIKCMYAFDKRPFSTHVEMFVTGVETMENMPVVFQNVEQAEPYYSLMVRQTMHFLTACAAIAQTKPSEALSTLEAHVGMQENLKLDPNTRWHNVMNAGFDKSLQVLLRWNVAFEPVLAEARKNKSSKSYLHAMVLQSYTKSALLRFTKGKGQKKLKSENSLATDQYSFNSNFRQSFFKYPSNAHQKMQIDPDGPLQNTNAEAPSKQSTSALTESDQNGQVDGDEYLPPVHVLKGVKYGYLNPMEAFGWHKGTATSWYQARREHVSGPEGELIVIYEKRNATGSVEITVVDTDEVEIQVKKATIR